MTKCAPYAGTSRRRLLARVFAAALLALPGTESQAASGGIALVVGNGQYSGQPALPDCSRTAHAVSARLQQLGFTVNETIDASAVSLRDALGDFAARAKATQETLPALVYVCAEAAAVDRRLFVLPSDVDLQQSLRPETQGVVLRALLNALAGTKGTMVAELSALPGTDTTPATAALQEALPEGLHLALTIGDGKQAPTLGARLASDGTALDQGWDRLAAALQGSPQGAPTAITLYEPPPMPPQAAPAAAPAPAPAPAPVPMVAAAPAPLQPAPTLAAAGIAPGGAIKRPADKHPDAKPARQKPSGDERTRRLQDALTQNGFYSGPLDGVADARTVQAILSYQISLGDPATGSLTQTEVVHLLNDR